MQTDGQLYTRDSEAPPSCAVSEPKRGFLSGDRDILLLFGVIFLLTSDRKQADLPLILALIYILF